MIDLVARVAERTVACPVTIWGFGVGSALSGLVRAGSMLDRPDLVDHVATLVGPSLESPPDPTDHLIAIEAIDELARARPDLGIGALRQRWLRAVREAARPVESRPRVHRPDLERWSTTIWVDCMHTDGPGLAALGHPGEAVEAATEYAAALQRDDGLFHHGYDVNAGHGNGVAWGRGQAWALIGLTETLAAVTGSGACSETGAGSAAGLGERVDRLVAGLARHEDDGRWHTIVDDPTSPVEHSVGAYVAQVVPRAVRAGVVDSAYAAVADRASAATLAALGEDGGLEVSEATPVGGPDTYRRRRTGVFPWGQAPVLHALLDRLSEEAA